VQKAFIKKRKKKKKDNQTSLHPPPTLRATLTNKGIYREQLSQSSAETGLPGMVSVWQTVNDANCQAHAQWASQSRSKDFCWISSQSNCLIQFPRKGSYSAMHLFPEKSTSITWS